MKLRELLQDCDFMNGEKMGDMDIAGLAYDSRKVREDYLFVAIKGERHDGHDFIDDAVERGAKAVIVERDFKKREVSQRAFPLYILVKDSRKALACIANNFYARPSENLTMIGVTGTNGKTTTTYILKSILEAWGKEVGLIGTIQYMIKNRSHPAPHTTPESLEFQRLLKDMLLSGCTHVISEVSSHGLAQYRVDGTKFKAVVFTNLTRDHLDFHKTMEGYFRAKERLFIKLLDRDGTSVINVDDPYGKRLITSLGDFSKRWQDSPGQRMLTYGCRTQADIMANDINNTSIGFRFKILFDGRSYDVSSPLIGISNIYNVMSAVGVSIAIGVPWKAILEGIERAANIAGRFEKVDIGQDFLCVIDYAHTEDALERLIYTARELTLPPHPPLTKGGYRGGDSSPRIITVFGCGGDRDRGKRPGMGAVATRFSDLVIITSDNPRSEEPLDIIKEIESGTARRNYLVEPDRKEAIRRAVDIAGDGDVLLIAGKGHEDYQEIKGIRYGFSDREILEEAIKNKLKVQI
ncbi:MAG: UDP-N-acetylmuramoyl-L-alanyl-D-glutamate--2,6-diaminopimelate ligase [Nitrospirota bacterium]